jgi:hypothetical protein
MPQEEDANARWWMFLWVDPLPGERQAAFGHELPLHDVPQGHRRAIRDLVRRPRRRFSNNQG